MNCPSFGYYVINQFGSYTFRIKIACYLWTIMRRMSSLLHLTETEWSNCSQVIGMENFATPWVVVCKLHVLATSYHHKAIISGYSVVFSSLFEEHGWVFSHRGFADTSIPQNGEPTVCWYCRTYLKWIIHYFHGLHLCVFWYFWFESCKHCLLQYLHLFFLRMKGLP